MRCTALLLLTALLVPPQTRAGIFTGRGGLFYDESEYKQRVEEIRGEEGILFDGLAFWFKGSETFAFRGLEMGVVATPRALVFESGERIPYSYIDTVRVGDFPHSVDPSARWDDILVINEYHGLLLIPDGKLKTRTIRQTGSPAQRALADDLAGILEAHLHTVDAFGKALPPRPVNLATVILRPHVDWTYSPEYLNARYKAERKAFDELFSSTREAISNAFHTGVAELLDNWDVQENAYTLIYAGGFEYGRTFPYGEGNPATDPYGPNAFDKVNVAQLNLKHQDLITLGYLSLGFQEKMDPQGNPSVNINMCLPCNLFDTATGLHTRSTEIHVASMKLTLREWLDGGQDRIVAEIKTGLKEILEKVERDINARAISVTVGDSRP